MTEKLNIHEAAQYLKVSEMYLRKKINDGTIPTTREQLIGNIYHHMISKSDLDVFKKRTSNRSSRSDNRNKFTTYLTKSEESKLRELLKANNLTQVSELLNRANPSKTKK